MTINLKNFLNTKPKLSKMGEFQELKPIDGLEISSFSADLYKNGRDDLALFYFKDGANYSAMYTSNSIVSQTIEWNKKSNKSFTKALLVNTKNANTFTGDQGVEGVDLVAKNLSRILTLRESKSDQGVSETVKMKELIFASTGVIGEKFPAENIVTSLQPLVDKLRDDHNKLIWIKTASAIMTTDTKPKVAYEEIVVGNTIIKLAGVAKGSGMIAPNLATMLSFIFTNADINSNLLKTLLKRAVANSFNAITVDSDQSTNDMISIFSTRSLKIGQNLSLNDNDQGVYAVEEGFSKELIERNKKRNGPIFGVDEVISDKKDGIIFPNILFDLYSKKYWLNNYPELTEKALSKLNRFKKGDLGVEKVFDLKKWATYFAVVDFSKAFHGAIIKSVKFYYNPGYIYLVEV